jgi:hypothetical protein
MALQELTKAGKVGKIAPPLSIRKVRIINESHTGCQKIVISGSPCGPDTPPDASGSLCNSVWWAPHGLSSILDLFRDQVGCGRFRVKLSRIKNLKPPTSNHKGWGYTKWCAMLLNSACALDRAFRCLPGPREVPHTYENKTHEGPSARRASAWRALGLPYAVISHVWGGAWRPPEARFKAEAILSNIAYPQAPAATSGRSRCGKCTRGSGWQCLPICATSATTLFLGCKHTTSRGSSKHSRFFSRSSSPSLWYEFRAY